jgi:16S rRNA (cytosine967-C5)-methyltransferase
MKYREYVIKSLEKIIVEKKYSNIETQYVAKLIDEKMDRDLYQFNLYGVIENLIFIDWVLMKISSVKINKINHQVLNILRLAIFQIFFANKPKPSQIVYESVEMTKKYLVKSQGFVNGILRNVIRQKSSLIKELEAMDGIKYLSLKYSYPEDFLNILIKEFDYEETARFCECSNLKPDLIFRVNSSIISRDELINNPLSQDLKFEKTKLSGFGVILKNPSHIEKMTAYTQGLITPQDESSMLVAEILNPAHESQVLDVCCAPGGKCLHTAELMGQTGRVIGHDIFEHKLKLVENNIIRLGLKNIEVSLQDATILNKNYLGQFDYCIVDVPCSNSGIIRRKPELKYAINDEAIKKLIPLQRTILANASQYLAKNGIMSYSTCSIFDDENINIVKDFLNKNSNFSLQGIRTNYLTAEEGYIKLFPHINGTDGFFIAIIKRNY